MQAAVAALAAVPSGDDEMHSAHCSTAGRQVTALTGLVVQILDATDLPFRGSRA